MTLLQSEERFKAITEATYGGIIIHKDGVILECNNALSDITGYTYEELIGCDGLKLISPEYIDLVRINMRSKQHESYEIIGLHKNGFAVPLSIKGKDIIFKNEPARVIELIDITEHKKTEEQLKLAASVFTHAREGIMITNKTGEIIEINDTFTRITGYDRDYVIGKNPSLLKSGLHEENFYSEIWQALQKNHEWSGELWNLRQNGELFASLLTISAVSDHNGNIKTYVALFSDITEMKQHQQQLEHIAHYDVLTNLPNRILLAQRLKQAMRDTKKTNLSLAVVYLDLDGFKIVNDTYGHDVGDALLIELSRLMTACLREGDTLARIGGDEFVAVLTNIEVMDDCERVIKRLLKTAMTPIIVDNAKTAQVSTSIGITLYPYDYVEADQLMRHADQAMYRAKQTGKNRYHLFDVHQDKSIQSQHESIANINRGIENSEFLIHYQPKVNMISGVVIGVEALIRWQHPTRGLIYPKDFLHIINNHPISIKLGEWIIDTVLDQMEDWQRQELNIPVSINIDAFQLEQPGFVEKLSAALNKRSLIKLGLLQLEILETSALGDISKVLPIMNACIDIGVTFALDDFGTGFSSLTYLRRLSAELLKIDQSFVRDMLDDPDDRAIVMGVISLASAFNHKVIAEGVESIDHGTQLIAMGCVLAQGFGIAKPMLPEKIPAWIEQWKPDPNWIQ
jgi:diguanylate cyclase (GGDEF)-like protein/PAS domain S-box-containing protein